MPWSTRRYNMYIPTCTNTHRPVKNINLCRTRIKLRAANYRSACANSYGYGDRPIYIFTHNYILCLQTTKNGLFNAHSATSRPRRPRYQRACGRRDLLEFQATPQSGHLRSKTWRDSVTILPHFVAQSNTFIAVKSSLKRYYKADVTIS